MGAELFIVMQFYLFVLTYPKYIVNQVRIIKKVISSVFDEELEQADEDDEEQGSDCNQLVQCAAIV